MGSATSSSSTAVLRSADRDDAVLTPPYACKVMAHWATVNYRNASCGILYNHLVARRS